MTVLRDKGVTWHETVQKTNSAVHIQTAKENMLNVTIITPSDVKFGQTNFELKKKKRLVYPKTYCITTKLTFFNYVSVQYLNIIKYYTAHN